MDKQKLTTLELISGIIANSHNLNETLKSIVLLVKSRVKSEVCSIYLIDDYEEVLILKATIGLNLGAVNKVKVPLSKGLVGETVRSKKPVFAPIAAEHEAYEYIPETGEKKVTSFLGIPLFDRGKVIGVLTVQTKKQHIFSESEIKLIHAIAGQVSLVIVNAKLLEFINSQKEELQKEKDAIDELNRKKRQTKRENIRLYGVPASKGVSVGKAQYFKVKVDLDSITDEKVNNPKQELEKYLSAVEKSKIQLVQLEIDISKVLSEEEGKIFQTHLMILEDTSFHNKIHNEIDEGWNAQTAVKTIIKEYIKAFMQIEDEYLRERVNDIRDVGNRILSNILNKNSGRLEIPENAIIIAKSLTATDIATIDVKNVKGILLEKGGAISHTTILAKSFGIPVVAGVTDVFSLVKEGEKIAIDGNSGNVYINPDEKIKQEYYRLEKEFKQIATKFQSKKDEKAATKDGTELVIGANVGLLSELELAKQYGAEEIGLYRSEFSFSIRDNFPTEEEQYHYYKSIITKFDKGVTFRILDIGGDKHLSYFKIPPEENPFLGYKSIRILFNELDIFKDQIKAVLRASAHGKVKIMFPMVTNLEEVIHIKRIYEECQKELASKNVKYDENMEIGVMIEVPSAAIICSEIAKHVDFFSIGTNDLIQYLLAVDRNNRIVAKMYRPLHPAVLKTIKQIIDTGHDAGIWVSMCGEMAGNYLYTPMLIGMGLDKFHMAPANIQMVKLTMLETDYEKAKQLSKEILTLTRPKETRKLIIENHPFDVDELSFHEVAE